MDLEVLDFKREPSLATEAAFAPVTKERKLNLNLQDKLTKPYLARALVAADPSHPNGTEGWDDRGMSVLQQHASFFDRNGDGIIYPWETYLGFRAIGCGFLFSLCATFFTNFFLSLATQPGWIPSPLFPIYIKNIHKGKHGSDSETYDTEGRFDPSKFDAIFNKYARTHENALTASEISTMLKANRNFGDFGGWIASFAEWQLLYSLAKDENGLLHRETVRGTLDGSLFVQLEKEKKKKKKIKSV